MVVAAAKGGFWRKELEKVFPRVEEIPFDSDRKRMTTIHENKQADCEKAVPAGFDCPPIIAFVKGAPDVVLDLCGRS